MYNKTVIKKLERIYNHTNLLLNQNLTVREISKLTGYSKSTVHRDIHVLLRVYDLEKFIQASEVLKRHRFEQKHRKG